MYDVTSAQYRAAKWLADDDSERLVVPSTTATATDSSSFNFVQRYVLTVLYFGLGGPSWINNYHFVSNDQHECSWFDVITSNNEINDDKGRNDDIDIKGRYYAMGVTCGHDLQVRSIVLHENNLTGIIPSEIEHLSNLIYLDLSKNSISGPSRFQALDRLEYLNLSDNQLTGSLLPYWLFGGTGAGSDGNNEKSMINKSLRFLDLSSNNLVHSNIVNDDAIVSEPASRNTYYNNRDSNYHHLGNISPLETLALGNNKNDHRLVNNNEIKNFITVPEQIQKLTNLRRLSLNGMNLHGTIPSWLGAESRHLELLLLHDNELTGTVPESIGSLPNLSTLTLHHNNVTLGNDTGSFICSADSAYFSSSYPKAKLMLESLTTDCGDSTCPCCVESCCDTDDCFQNIDFWDVIQSGNDNDFYTW